MCAVHFKFVRDTVGLVLKKTKLSPIKAGTCWRNKKFTMVSFFYFGVSGRVLLPVYGGGRVEVLAGLECVWLCILFIIYYYYDVLCSTTTNTVVIVMLVIGIAIGVYTDFTTFFHIIIHYK